MQDSMEAVRAVDGENALERRLLAAAAVAGAKAREAAERTESNRRVPQELIEEMRDAGLYSVLKPKLHGGYEAGFGLFAKLVSEIARGDGSTGWVFSVCAVHQWLIALFPAEAQAEVWAGERDSFAAGSYAPVGKGEIAPGGYRFTGAWSFSSGCDTADWLLLGTILPPGGERPAGPSFFLVPKSQCRVDDESWKVVGLAGTGSKTVYLDDVFVPAYRTLSFAEGTSGNAPGTLVNTNPLYRIPFMACVPSCLVAPPLGMAEAALDHFLDNATGRSTRGAVAGGNNRMAEFAGIQMRATEAAASIDVARTLLQRDLAETQAMVDRGEEIGVDTRLRNRRTHAYVVKLMVEATDGLFQSLGGRVLDLGDPMQRVWRDIRAAGTHISTNWDAVATMYGQNLLGLEPRGQY